MIHITSERNNMLFNSLPKIHKQTTSEMYENKDIEEEVMLQSVFEEKELRCYLEVVRAIDDDIYCMVYERHSKNYYLHRIRFYEEDTLQRRLTYSFQPV